MPKAAYDFRGEKNVSEMQMVFADYPFGAQWHGKRVIVTGKLFHAFTSAHRTKVLIMVKNARAVEEVADEAAAWRQHRSCRHHSQRAWRCTPRSGTGGEAGG